MVKTINHLQQEQPVLPFPIEVYPKTVSNFALAVAISTNCNVDFVTAAVLLAASAAIGSRVKLQIKKGWTEGAVMFLIVIGEPGSKKTPAISKAIAPLLELQMGFGKPKGDESDQSKPKKLESIITTDATIEALAQLLMMNPHGLLLFKDEAIGWLKSMNMYRSGGEDMEKYLSIWSQTLVRVDRKDKPSIQINFPFVSFIGGMQPEVLAELASMKANGFSDRLLWCNPPPIPSAHTDEELQDEIKDQYVALIHRIYAAQKNSEQRVLPFSTEAQQLWKKWHTEYCENMNSTSVPYYMKGALSKMEAYTARFALILEFLRCAELDTDVQNVSEESLTGAIKLTAYFASHAEKSLHSFTSTSIYKQIAKAIEWLKKQKGGSCNLRKFYTHRVAGVKGATDAYDLLLEMKSRGLGTMDEYNDRMANGRKGYYFTLNQALMNDTKQPNTNTLTPTTTNG
jgi:hypothetical protein